MITHVLSPTAVIFDMDGLMLDTERPRNEAIQVMLEQVEKGGIPHRPDLITLLDHLDSMEIPLGLATSTAQENGLKIIG
jgi:beta-phosphoglucomutase-like phosphatase (HAD superfamily)